jgi:hypothetical protein
MRVASKAHLPHFDEFFSFFKDKKHKMRGIYAVSTDFFNPVRGVSPGFS